MGYTEFKLKAQRDDKSTNDKIHFFSSHFSSPVAFFLHKLGFTPNGVTFLFLIIGLLSSISLYLSFPFLCYLLWRFHIILDMADGSLARATNKFSKSAIGFDRSNHIVINTTLLLVSAQSVQNIFLVSFLIISFYLYYFFGRNYYLDNNKTREFSLTKNFIKNILSLEGYIMLTCLLVFLELQAFQSLIVLFYGLNFLALYFYKLRLFFAEASP